MTKSEDVLAHLDESVPEYIKDVGTFQFEGEKYALVGHYRSETYLTCQVCGHERIVDIYVVMDSSSKKWIVGNVCIGKISNQKIHEWFTSYKQKKDNIEKNKYLIDKVAEILEDLDKGRLPIFISKIGIKRLRKMLDRMCKGLQPLEETVRLANYYIRKLRR